MSRFVIGSENFELDGQPIQLISGAMHYFRIHPDQWAQRIATAKAMGLNTIETYVAWNFHAPTPEEFILDGGRDLGRFLDLIAEAGLNAIVRPGPYICSEWDNGGLPAWLLSTPGMQVRRMNEPYLAAIAAYLDALLPVVAARQVDRGGPVLMMQVENEYGAYGNDKDYLRTLAQMFRDRDITVPLFTCDQANDDHLEAGGLPELHKTATFGSRSLERFATLRRHQPTGPLMVMEYWNGWFDAWGQHHHVTDPEGSAADLAELLASGGSVNFYMVHGGTNFGLTNGANHKGAYHPTITSYDYDAPMAEDGTATDKYDGFQRVIHAHLGRAPHAQHRRRPAPVVRADHPVRGVSLWELVDARATWTPPAQLPSHDDLGIMNGFSVYRTRVEVPADAPIGVVRIGEVRDRAQVFCNRIPIGVLDRSQAERALTFPAAAFAGESVLIEILVEDQGRVNYGPRIGEEKGLIGPVTLTFDAATELTEWQVTALPIDAWAAALAAGEVGGPVTPADALPGPAWYAWHLGAPAGTDLFLDTTGWGKGIAWANGWNLGRYWGKGPQQSLYVPSPTVTETTTVVTFELLAAADSAVVTVSGPQWTFRSDD